MKLFFRVAQGLFNLRDSLHRRGLLMPPDYGDAEALALREALRADDWQAARAALIKTRQQWPRRMFLIDNAAESNGEPPWLNAWIEAEPNSPEAHLVLASLLLHLAWQARGGGYGDTISERAVREFFERLVRAQRSLMRATQLAPDDPTPWAKLVTVARGLQLDHPTAAMYFRQAVERDPHHYQAHLSWQQFVCAKWYGSNQEMWEFTNEVYSAAPPGSPLCALVSQAHIEHANALASGDNVHDPDRVEQQYWAQHAVRTTTVAAFRKMHVTDAAPSDHVFAAHGIFAYALWRCGAHVPAAEAFAVIGDRLTGPWHNEAMPAKTFRRARRECGAA